MISVTEAKKIISENVSSLEPVSLSLQESAGLILAEDVYASMDIPAFPQSSISIRQTLIACRVCGRVPATSVSVDRVCRPRRGACPRQ